MSTTKRTRKRNELLGALAWRVGNRAAKKKAAENRAKLSAAGVILLVLVAGIAASKTGSD